MSWMKVKTTVNQKLNDALIQIIIDIKSINL